MKYTNQCCFLKMLVKTPTSAAAVAECFYPQLHNAKETVLIRKYPWRENCKVCRSFTQGRGEVQRTHIPLIECLFFAPSFAGLIRDRNVSNQQSPIPPLLRLPVPGPVLSSAWFLSGATRFLPGTARKKGSFPSAYIAIGWSQAFRQNSVSADPA